MARSLPQTPFILKPAKPGQQESPHKQLLSQHLYNILSLYKWITLILLNNSLKARKNVTSNPANSFWMSHSW